MKKILSLVFSFFFLVNLIVAQPENIDSLKHEINIASNDTIKIVLFGKLSGIYTETNPDSAYYYADKMLAPARKLNFKLEEVHALAEMGYALLNMGNYPRSLQILLSAIAIANNPKSEQNILPQKLPAIDEFTDRDATPHMQRLHRLGRTEQYIGILYFNANNYEKALSHYLEARQLVEQSGNPRLLAIINSTLGRTYLSLKKPDSALIVEQKAYDLSMQVGYKRYLGSILLNLGRIYTAQGRRNIASEYFRQAITVSTEQGYIRGVIAGNLLLADFYKQSGNPDSSLHYINTALPLAHYLNAPELLLRSYTALADYYKSNSNSDSAVKYQSLIIKINDSLFNSKQAQQFQNIDFDEQQKQKQIETAKATYRDKVRTNILIAGIAIFLFIAIILWRNSRQRRLANALLSRQKKELESTLTTLKAAQKQLIHSEKMASLGELTAGIAHEIQNPLNFVNNFSELNTELIDELQDALNKNDKEEAISLLNGIKENEEKINYHGKRADSIVKGMLQHSRSSSGQKELTDINSLADECLRLSYHGMRAKDKSFNVTIDSDFDNSIGQINIIPQDIGRVLLNLFTNSFYAVTDKRNQLGNNYEPKVSVSTKKVGDGIEIRVKDNGNGIPEKVLDKIFQPFFTTKPTGIGTGLGLSLSYDIIKAHDGEIKVETKENEGSEFILQLPTN